MRKIFTFLFVSILILGCAVEKDIVSIAPVSQKLKENPFNIWYPQDWKFKSAYDELSSGLVKRSYIVYHPENKYCRIVIEVFEPSPSNSDATIQKNRIIASKIRSLQQIFQRDGFSKFKMESDTGFYLGNKNTTRLKVEGNKGSITREVVLYAIKKGTQMCMVSYQWHDSWSRSAKERILEAVNSFHF